MSQTQATSNPLFGAEKTQYSLDNPTIFSIRSGQHSPDISFESTFPGFGLEKEHSTIVTFDFDETIAHTEPLVLAAIQKTFLRQLADKKLSDGEINSFKEKVKEVFDKNPGGGLADKYTNVCKALSNQSPLSPLLWDAAQNIMKMGVSELTAEHEKSNLEAIPELVESKEIYLKEGMVGLIDDLKEKGYYIIICTNRATESLLSIANALEFPIDQAVTTQHFWNDDMVVQFEKNIQLQNAEGELEQISFMNYTNKKTDFLPKLLKTMYPRAAFKYHFGDAGNKMVEEKLKKGEDSFFADNLGAEFVYVNNKFDGEKWMNELNKRDETKKEQKFGKLF